MGQIINLTKSLLQRRSQEELVKYEKSNNQNKIALGMHLAFKEVLENMPAFTENLIEKPEND